MDLLAAGHRGGPTVVGRPVRGDDLQAGVVGIAPAHCRAQFGLMSRRAHRSDQLRAHVAGPTGDQDRAHRSTPKRPAASMTPRSDNAWSGGEQASSIHHLRLVRWPTQGQLTGWGFLTPTAAHGCWHTPGKWAALPLLRRALSGLAIRSGGLVPPIPSS
jgi:hypothetical protein